ncbi:MAG TPA: sulfatase-like hydrolase/transferase [Candidatus Polarisedimenticolaceae bacterium]|nr:sulfatase-like hydrolase/transferase [Candidatus Polarisedimenticolaceae bacterium]
MRLLFVLGVALLAACAPKPRDDLSLILVTLDTTRADRIGAFGGKAVPTPVLDRLAAEGTIALDATSQVPLTLPSHATILTGRYPDGHGVRHNGIYRLRDEEETLAEHLRAAGFTTAAFVGAYVLNRGFGTEQGFDVYDDVDVNRFAGGRDQVFEAQRTADEVNAHVLPWLDAHAGKRFFLWVHYYDPHAPYAPPERPGRTLAGTGYDREISYVDACLGDLVARLRSSGVLDRAVLAIVGDHGESLGEHGEATHGLLLYQGALHVPFLLRAPGLVPRGGKIAGPVELAALAPTLVDYLGLPPLARAEGRSLRTRIDGKNDGHDAVAHAETMMPRLEFGWSDLRMLRDARFKYIRAPRPELYDLAQDPGEARDLSQGEASRTRALADRLDAWVAGFPPAGESARRDLDPDEEARLRSLGYLQGPGGGSGGRLIDPKDGLLELRALDAAREALDAGNARGALDGARAIVAKNPANHQARTTAVMALLALGDAKEAEDEAAQAVAAAEADRDAPRALVLKAKGLEAGAARLSGKLPEAEKLYRAILAEEPSGDAAAVDLARLLVAEKRLDEASTLLDAALRRDPRNGMALAARFALATASGDDAARLAAAKALADARAGDPEVLPDAAALLAASGDAARAAACYAVLVDLAPHPGVELLGKLGVTALKAGAFDAAADAFTRGAAAAPGDPRPVYYLGVVAAKRGDTEGARRAYERALALDPGFTKAREALRALP